MPPLDASRVHTGRAAVLWALRLTALAMMLLGLYRLGQRLLFWLITGEGTTAFKAWDRGVGYDHGSSVGLTLIALAAALAAASRPLARWATPAPTTGCPHCGYPAQGTTCQECGYHLP